MARALHVNGDHARNQYNFLAHVRMEEREQKALKQNTIAVPSRNLIKQAEFYAEMYRLGYRSESRKDFMRGTR
ncbi:TPA: hypothetical protein MIM75_06685 [Klebsiella variicola]|nr:hypothetical protein [Klebsiella variicola]HBX9969575.1 hypothetical protein [Klebsiella variicola]